MLGAGVWCVGCIIGDFGYNQSKVTTQFQSGSRFCLVRSSGKPILFNHGTSIELRSDFDDVKANIRDFLATLVNILAGSGDRDRDWQLSGQ
jgi:hypothetical protein